MAIEDPGCPPECFPDDDGDRHQQCPQDAAVADILATAHHRPAEVGEDVQRRAAGDAQ